MLVSVFEGLSGSRRFYCLLPWVYSNPTLRSLLFTLKKKRRNPDFIEDLMLLILNVAGLLSASGIILYFIISFHFTDVEHLVGLER